MAMLLRRLLTFLRRRSGPDHWPFLAGGTRPEARAVCVPGFAVIRIVRSAEGFGLYGRYLRAGGGGKIT